MVNYWGIIPAAGIGARMNCDTPKQFMNIGDKSILEWTVEAVASFSKLRGLYVGLGAEPDRREWAIGLHPKIRAVYRGGQSRSETVLYGLTHMLNEGLSKDDWVLVHDANRPLLKHEDVESLLLEVGDDEDGGILCLPIHDTVKRGIRSRITKTLPRSEIYSAQTPQLFKLGLLHDALAECRKFGKDVTDESQAMELKGYRPKLVLGSPTNLKITIPADIEFAGAILQKK